MSKKQKKKGYNPLHYFWCGFIGIISGIFSFFIFAISFKYFSLTTTNPQLSISIDPINFIGLIINTFLILLVLRNLSRKDDIEKVEREIIINHFKSFETEFCKEIHKITSSEYVDGSELASTFKRFDMSLQGVIEIAKTYSLNQDEESIVNLLNTFSNIRELLSNTPREGEVEDGIRVNGNNISYSPKHIFEITKSMNEFNKNIFNIIVLINRI